MKKGFISITDFSKDEIDETFDIATKLKKEMKEGIKHHLLSDRILAMIFEKPSLRTRVTFEAGMVQLGGHAIYLSPQDIQLGKRESVPDVAENLSRWVNCIMARTFAHSTVKHLAENATVPVINALSDREHPCQILADFFTILEHKNKLKGLTLSYVGDANNVCNSIILFSSIFGLNLRVASPKGYEPNTSILMQAEEVKNPDFQLMVTNDAKSAVRDADVIYTDVWASMGQEAEKEKRREIFKTFQVNSTLVSDAKNDVIVMHCLPAHREEEITSEVLDGIHSVVLDEAENRLHTEKALLVKLLTR